MTRITVSCGKLSTKHSKDFLMVSITSDNKQRKELSQHMDIQCICKVDAMANSDVASNVVD